MKKLLTLLTLLATISTYGQTTKVMTYNLRYNNPNDAPNHWEARKPAATYAIESQNPDLLGVQEALESQVQFLDSLMAGYQREGVGRDNGDTEGEYSAIYFRTDRFEKLDGGTFWLSETPEKVSQGWDGACIRIATWLKLRDKASNQEFLYLNTHFDHEGKIARQQSSTLINQRIEQLAPNIPVIVSGDFNAHEDDDPIVYLLKSPRLVNSRNVADRKRGKECTYHNFGKTDGGIIDYIFTSKEIEVKKSEILKPTHRGIYLSDHAPVVATLIL